MHLAYFAVPSLLARISTALSRCDTVSAAVPHRLLLPRQEDLVPEAWTVRRPGMLWVWRPGWRGRRNRRSWRGPGRYRHDWGRRGSHGLHRQDPRITANARVRYQSHIVTFAKCLWRSLVMEHERAISWNTVERSKAQNSSFPSKLEQWHGWHPRHKNT